MSVLEPTTRLRSATAALAVRASWSQLAKFCTVGGSGYVVNLSVYVALLHVGLGIVPSAAGSFAVAVANNYTLNRLWTFRASRGDVVGQGFRYLAVSCASLLANLAVLSCLVAAGGGRVVAQAVAIVLVTPLGFLGNKLWSFAR